jgi:transmembrane sensor
VQNELNHIDDLIGKYLAGEASAEEANLVNQWLSMNERNRNYFNQMKMIFARAASITEVQQFDTDGAWNKLRSKLQDKDVKVIDFRPERNHATLFLRIAASVIIVMFLGIFAYRFFAKQDVEAIQIATSDQTESDTLPDGSAVFLNKKTELAYAFDKKKKTHIVKLKGEAYFNVHHRDKADLIVKVDEVYIKDIGTSFNVKGYPDSDKVEVYVEQGEVMFFTDTDSGVYLKQGAKGVYDKLNKQFYIEKPETNITAYKTRFFSFADTDLQTVVNELNKVYERKIVVPANLANCRLTVTFNNETAEEIAQVIAETLDLSVKTTSKNILLEGQGCGK